MSYKIYQIRDSDELVLVRDEGIVDDDTGLSRVEFYKEHIIICVHYQGKKELEEYIAMSDYEYIGDL